jgi:uncharacterized membrane protein
MKRIAAFTRTTLVGGILVVLPAYLTFLVLAKGLQGLLGLLAPVAAQLPAAVELRGALAAVLLVAICFVTGLIVRTGPGLRAVDAFQHAILERIPGYAMLRSVVRRLSGETDETSFQPALVRMDDGLAVGFIVEVVDADRVVVLLPSVPTPAAGNLLVVEASRVQAIDVPFTTAFQVFAKWGSGTAAIVRAADAARPATVALPPPGTR